MFSKPHCPYLIKRKKINQLIIIASIHLCANSACYYPVWTKSIITIGGRSLPQHKWGRMNAAYCRVIKKKGNVRSAGRLYALLLLLAFAACFETHTNTQRADERCRVRKKSVAGPRASFAALSLSLSYTY